LEVTALGKRRISGSSSKEEGIGEVGERFKVLNRVGRGGTTNGKKRWLGEEKETWRYDLLGVDRKIGFVIEGEALKNCKGRIYHSLKRVVIEKKKKNKESMNYLGISWNIN